MGLARTGPWSSLATMKVSGDPTGAYVIFMYMGGSKCDVPKQASLQNSYDMLLKLR
jgi:hypothetical protein